MHALSLDRMSGVAHYATTLLDEVLPLRGASHADVVRYKVEVPMRYAECFGVLACGRKVALANNRQFVGWSCHDDKRWLLFRNEDVQIEIQVDPDDPFSRHEPGFVRDIILKPRSEVADDGGAERKFIAIDGSLLTI